MQKASELSPLLTGSTIVMTAAAAIAASTALPRHSMRRPACAPSGCEVDTALRVNTGMRVEEQGLHAMNDELSMGRSQSNWMHVLYVVGNSG